MQLLIPHLTAHAPNLKPKVKPCEAVCAFTGVPITEGVLLDELLSDVFTDYEYLRYPSKFASVGAACCIAEVLPAEKKLNSLRNYSFFATASEFRYLQRDSALALLLNMPATPFVVGITYSNKKHLSYKSRTQTNPAHYIVTTDVGDVLFDLSKAVRILSLCQPWYSVSLQNAAKADQPTNFTKAEILTGQVANYGKIVAYGVERFASENAELQQFRNTPLLDLIVHLLNKQVCLS